MNQPRKWPAEMATGEMWADMMMDVPTPEELERERELVRSDEQAEDYAAYLESVANTFDGSDEGPDDCEEF